MRKILLSLAGILLLGGAATAAKLPEKHVSARLLSEAESIQPGQPFWVGVELKTAKGWHVYWKNPGDSGMATKVKWTLPDGFSAEPLQWPYPRQFSDSAGTTYGYTGKTLLLTRIQAPEALSALPEGSTVAVSARLEWLECSEICVPGRAELSLVLPVRPGSGRRNPALARRFSESRLRLPLPLEETDWKVRAFRRKRQIQVRLSPPKGFRRKLSGLVFFPDHPGLVDTSEPQTLSRSQGEYVLSFPFSQLTSVSPSSLEGVIVSRYGWRGPGTSRALAVNVRIE